MLKYLLAAVAGIAGLFLGVLLAALAFPKSGNLVPAFGAGVAIGAARLVYGIFRDRELKSRGKDVIPAMLSSDYKNFAKIFSGMDCRSMGITEIKYLEQPDQVNYFIGIRAENFQNVSQEAIRKALYKEYYSHIKFDFIDLSSEQGAALNQSGVAIPLAARGA